MTEEEDVDDSVESKSVRRRTTLITCRFLLLSLCLSTLTVLGIWVGIASLEEDSESLVIPQKLFHDSVSKDDYHRAKYIVHPNDDDLIAEASNTQYDDGYYEDEYEDEYYPNTEYEIFANVLDNIRQYDYENEEDVEDDDSGFDRIKVIVRNPNDYQDEEYDDVIDIPNWMKVSTVEQQHHHQQQHIVPNTRNTVHPIPQQVTKPQVQNVEAGEKTSIVDSGDSIANNRLPFFLGVVPATLASLLVLGHLPPFQILILGALIVTGFLIVSKDETAVEGKTLQEQDPDINGFVDAVSWLDESVFGPLLNEDNIRLLYRLSVALDKYGELQEESED